MDKLPKLTPAQLEFLAANREQLERRALFAVCISKEHLHAWIKRYLKIDLPDTIVCDDDVTTPASNSTPMDLVWEIYQKALQGDDEKFQRVLAYAARDSFKTLSASVLEILCLFHLRRDVAHMAAIEAQAQKAASYVSKYLNFPYLRDFVSGNNKREIRITRYEDSRGNILTPREFEELEPRDQRKYEPISHYMKIVIATLSGANCVDPTTFIRLANGEDVLAVDIKSGDEILNFDLKNHTWTTSKVGSVVSSIKAAMKVSLDDGSYVVVSEDHPVLTTRGWIRARALRLTDKVLPPPISSTTQVIKPPILADGVTLESFSVDQLILGSVLGDSSLTWPKNSSGDNYGSGPRFQVYHCAAQLPYLYHKKEILENAGIKCSVYMDPRGGGKLMTGVLPQYADYYRMMYPENKKQVTKEWLSKLTDEGLAYWLMDDGSGSPQKLGSRKDKHISIATCGFSLQEHQLIVDLFLAKGLNPKIGTVTNQSSKTWNVIEFDLDSSRELSSRLDKWIHPVLKYKFPTPFQLLDTRCIETGAPIQRSSGLGFSRITRTPKVSERERWSAFRDMFTRSIQQLEFLGKRVMMDISVDTDDEMKRNFVANSSLLLHNSEHVSFMVLDELDLAPAGPVEEAKMIPAPGQVRGELPITFMTSTRKFAIGLVQQEIDKAQKDSDYHLQIRHWNIIDVTKRCEPKRHLPEEPKIPIYYSEHSLRAISEPEYNLLSTEEKTKFLKQEGYAGCLRNCSLFAVCKGRLATKQKVTDDNVKPRPMLKPIPHVLTQFKSVNPDHAKAQLMCWKPSSEGLIYPFFNYSRHMIDAAEMYEKITGEEIPKDQLNNFTKADLIKVLQEREVEFYTGMDWGYTHNWAAVTGAKVGHRFFVFDVIAVAELEVMQKIEMYKNKLGFLDATVFADPEDRSSIETFRKNGVRMRKWKKGSVIGGIDAVRTKLMPGLNKEPELYFLANDEGCELLADRIAKYAWVLDATQKPTDVPSDFEDDECDALRYVIVNLFGNRSNMVAAIGPVAPGVQYDPSFPAPRDGMGIPPGISVYQNETILESTTENWMDRKIQELTGNHEDPNVPKSGRKGSFSFDF